MDQTRSVYETSLEAFNYVYKLILYFYMEIMSLAEYFVPAQIWILQTFEIENLKKLKQATCTEAVLQHLNKYASTDR